MSIEQFTIVAPRLAFGLALLSLAGCQNSAQRDPLPYSNNYHVASAPGDVRKGYDAQSSRLIPDACVTPDVAEDSLYLPPGCANNLNLQMMVSQQGDLVGGRKIGPAMAAPVVRAARRVIDGTPVVQIHSTPSDVNTIGLQD